MASSVIDILSSGEMMEVHLLTKLPDNSDQNAWVKPSWPGYQGAFGNVVILDRNIPFGLRFEISCQFLSLGGAWDIVAVGVLYKGVAMMTAPMKATRRCYPNIPFPVKITGMCNAVV